MNEPQRRAQHPLDAQQKAHHVLQMCAVVLGLFLWLAWYFGWSEAGSILPFIGNPIVNTVTRLLPGEVQPVFNNSLVAGAFAAAAVAGAAWGFEIVLLPESLNRWVAEQQLKTIEAHAGRWQAARQRFARKAPLPPHSHPPRVLP